MKTWLNQASEMLPVYIDTLCDRSKTGKFTPCIKGATRIGKEASLGFSCFALKLFYILGLWQHLDNKQKNQWLGFINNFQNPQITLGNHKFENAFIDPVVIKNAYDYFRYPMQFLYHMAIQSNDLYNFFNPKIKRQNLTNPSTVILAETKQAIATLSEVTAKPKNSFLSYPQTPEHLYETLSTLNWREPWAAGGQAATYAVFIVTQKPHPPENPKTEELIGVFEKLYKNIADPSTGTYYQGDIPDFGQSINGSMKVLTALDWLQLPIHYPNQLIDTCLTQLPSPEGCHLVDMVYVLYRCLLYTNHRKSEVIQYLLSILDMIKHHYNSDGGFSYFVGRSQTSYYNIRISKGLPESDLHGTLLLTWAIAMILEMLEENQLGWRVLKP